MASERRASVHDHIWHFSVTDPQLHKKGFTVYKVTCKSFPIKSPEVLSEVVCWKRYNDFKTLYKSLFSLHKALHRPNPFPEFAKPKLFGRFDEAVIEERMDSAIKLLNFVASQPHLYKSLVFKKFFEDGKSKMATSKSRELLKPQTLDILSNVSQTSSNVPPDIVPTSSSVQPSSIDNTHVEDSDNLQFTSGLSLRKSETTTKSDCRKYEQSSGPAVLEGTWNYPQVADTISLSSSTSEDFVNSDDDSVLASSLPDADLAFFDPIDPANDENDQREAQLTHSNSWLLAGLNICAQMEDKQADEIDKESLTTQRKDTEKSNNSTITEASYTSDDKDSESSASTTVLPSSDLENFDPLRRTSLSSDTSRVECGKGDLDLSDHWQSRSNSVVSFGSAKSNSRTQSMTSEYTDKPERQQNSKDSIDSDRSQSPQDSRQSNALTPIKGATSLIRRIMSSSPDGRKSRSNTEHSVSSMDLGGKEDYIYLAASQISLAQSSEANGDYQHAFTYYKSGVGILLHGVQADSNKSRRDAVRRKTAQYLMKAEDLFNRHLAAEEMSERRWGTDSCLSPALECDPSLAFIRGSIKDLRNFQVLGTVGQVILVRDKSTDETFVIKSILKTPDVKKTHTILPTSCPYMVSLYKFYETDNAIFLLLQYASGGKLWTYIGDYLNQGAKIQQETGFDPSDCDVNKQNIYSGTRVEVGNEEEGGNNEKSPKTLVTTGEVSSQHKTLENTAVNTVETSEHAGVVRLSSLSRNGNNQSVEEKVENKTDTNLSEWERRLSSFSEDFVPIQENDSSILPSSLQDENQFQQILEEHRTNLEGFSINSFDSEDTPRYSSSYFERIDSIPESSEEHLQSLTSRQISADEVFEHNRKENMLSTVKTRNKSDSFCSNNSTHLAATFNTSDIVQSSRKLLQEVEKVLHDTVNENNEDASKTSSGTNSSVSLQKTKSNTSNESEDIYTKYRSSDSSDQNSQTNSPSPKKKSIEIVDKDEDENDITFQKTRRHTLPTRTCALPSENETRERHNSISNVFHQNNTPKKLALKRIDSKDMTRSASFECDLKSPSRNRVKTVADLFARLDSSSEEQIRIPETRIKKWVAQLVTAVSRLHSLGIICRDLKPSNILLGDGGHVFLSYFCYLGHGDQEIDWDAVENLYAAPEIRSITGFDKSCDWWSIGALLYELTVGRSLIECHPGGITSHTYLHVPTFVSPEASSLLHGLLTFNPHERLGSGMAGSEEIKAHPFFCNIDWNFLEYI